MTDATNADKAPVRLQPGTTVLDREQLAGFPALRHQIDVDAPSVGVVIDRHDTPADSFDVPELGRTVAEDNHTYPPSDAVVEVVWHAQLDEIATLWAGWSAEEIHEVAHARGDVTIYHFPVSRLVTPEEAAEVDTYSVAMDALGGSA